MDTSTSVIIPNYNYGNFIGEAIESVLAQTHQPNEILVVDDGSTDDSVRVVKSFGKKVKLIEQENGGVGKARNTGAKNSTGNLLAFLDADDIWFADKLEKQIKLFQSQPKFDYVSCGMREFNVSGKTIGEYVPVTNGWSIESILLYSEPIVASGSAIVVKREAFEKVGGFDEQRDLHPSEDWDFARRMSEICVIGAVSDILVHYRNHGNNGHLKISRFEHSAFLAFDKTFENCSPIIENLKTRAYGNLHKIVAGSYLQNGEYSGFLRNLLWSLWFRPSFIVYYLSVVLHGKQNNY